MEHSVEIHFAQRLAANEKTTRDRAIRRLRRWLSLRSAAKKNLSSEEMLKLWKGLFYCMWMSDKPLVQEELSDSISRLMFCFEDDDSAFLFLKMFHQTMCREWYGIDQLRMDKFLLLIRSMLTASLEFIKRHQWQNLTIDKFTSVIEALSMNSKETNNTVPLSFQLHITDIYIEELAKAAENQISPEVANMFLRPCCKLLVETNNSILMKNVIEQVFLEVIKLSNIAIKRKNRRSSKRKLQFDYAALSKQLMEMSSSKDVRRQNRNEGYSLVRKFDDLNKGIYPLKVKFVSAGVPLTIEDYNEKINTLLEECEKDREETLSWKKKRKSRADVDDEFDEDNDNIVHTESNVISSNRKPQLKKRKFFKNKNLKRKGFQTKKKPFTNKTRRKAFNKKTY